MIIDMIAELGDRCWSKKNIMNYVAEWSGDVDPDICMKIVDSLCGTGNVKQFKTACIEYMESYGYKGCAVYNRFKRMTLKEIAEKLSV